MQPSCDLKPKKGLHIKTCRIIDGYTIKYHANGSTMWSKGKMVDGEPDGYWEWYRIDGTLKRSGYFDRGKQVGEWITYDQLGNPYVITRKSMPETDKS